ncbi:MAG: endonuclease III [Bacteroidales bacterium]|jgi:endonuclease-3|nr:endonuclease III [Bacteroidales bacterium]
MKNSLTYKYDFLLRYFKEHNPNAASELKYHSAFELLVAVVLSAQCTDKRVNLVTKELFQQYPTAAKMAQATEKELFEYIKSVSYPNNKAKHLSGLSKKLVSDFNSKVPQDMEALQSLPGVGRKSANVILSVIFNQPAMAVDTHVFRVSNRLGIVKNAKTPLETEKQLVAHLPQEDIPVAHHWLILHGRYVCLARKPKCEECGLTEICSYFQKEG